MAASYRFAYQPRWLAGHVLVLAAGVAMVLLGRWQLTVSERKGFSLQNFGYALQWWAFTIFAVVFWVKILRDKVATAQPAPPPPAPVDEPVAYRRYVMPTPDTSEADPELTRYNAYLAALAEQDQPRSVGRTSDASRDQ